MNILIDGFCNHIKTLGCELDMDLPIRDLIDVFPDIKERPLVDELKCVLINQLRDIKWQKKTAKRLYKLFKSNQNIVYISNVEQIYADKCMTLHPEKVDDDFYCNECKIYIKKVDGCYGCDVQIRFPKPWYRRLFSKNKFDWRWIFIVDDERFSDVQITIKPESLYFKQDRHFMLNSNDALSSHITYPGSLENGLNEHDLENAIKTWFEYTYCKSIDIKWIDHEY